MLQQWDLQIKGLVKLYKTDDIRPREGLFGVDDFNLDQEDGILQPILDSTRTLLNLEDRRLQVGNSPTRTTLTSLVNKDILLNKKQQLVVERVLSSTLAWKDYAYNASKHN